MGYPDTKNPLIEPDALYDQLVAHGATIDHHESDLYTPVTEKTAELLARYRFKKAVTVFAADLESSGYTEGKPHRQWYCIPFAYKPFWIARNARG